MRTAALLLALVLALPACTLLGPTDDTLEVSLVQGKVFLLNRTDARRYYFVVGTETATLVDWGPHADLAHSVAPGEGRVVPDAHVVADEDEEALIVYTWRIAGPTDAQPLQPADWQTATLRR